MLVSLTDKTNDFRRVKAGNLFSSTDLGPRCRNVLELGVFDLDEVLNTRDGHVFYPFLLYLLSGTSAVSI